MKKSPDPNTSSNQASFFQGYAQRASQWASSILSNLMTANVKNDDKFYLDFWRLVLTQVDDIDTIEALTLTCKSVNKAANERAATLLPQMAQKAMQVRLSDNVDLTGIDKVINKLLVAEFNKINADESTKQSKQLVEVKRKPLPMATLTRIQAIRHYLERIDSLIDSCEKKYLLSLGICYSQRRREFSMFENSKRYFGFSASRRRPTTQAYNQLGNLKNIACKIFDSIDSLEQYEEGVLSVKDTFANELERIDSSEYIKAEVAELKDFLSGANDVDSTFSQISNMFKSFF